MSQFKLHKDHDGLYEFVEAEAEAKGVDAIIRSKDKKYMVSGREGTDLRSIDELLSEGLVRKVDASSKAEDVPAEKPAAKEEKAVSPLPEEEKEEKAPAISAKPEKKDEPEAQQKDPEPEPEPEKKAEPEQKAKPETQQKEPEPEPEPEPVVKIKYDEWKPGFDFVLERENEDAIPFRDPELCVVCDGMGGTGSKILVIDDKAKFAKAAWSFMEDIYKVGDGNMIDFVQKIQDDLFKDGDQLRASNATFASRIICARFAYIKRHRFPDLTSLLTFEEKEKKDGAKKQIIAACKEGTPSEYLPSLAEVKTYAPEYLKKAMIFITYGLAKVAKDYGIDHYADSMLAVLPATLCATFTHEVNKKRVTDVFWAGDSRAYAIIKGKGKGKGIQLIMQDDERGDGKMNNFICAERLAEMHYVRIDDLPKDAMIFACSDGAFDPFPFYDSTAIDAIFSKIMQTFADRELNNKEAWDEFAQVLSDTYKDNFRMDDISFALTVYGNAGNFRGKDFDIVDEESIKVFEECCERHPTLQTLNQLAQGNLLEDHYLEERAKVIVQSRPKVIADLYFSQEPDIGMPQELRDILANTAQPRKDVVKINDACYQLVKDKLKEGFEEAKAVVKGDLLSAIESAEQAFLEAKELFAKDRAGIMVDEPSELREYLDEVFGKEYSLRQASVRKYEDAASRCSALLESAYRDGSIAEKMDPEALAKIEAEIKPIEPTQAEKEEAALHYITSNVEPVARLVGKGLTENYDKTSALDKYCTEASLVNSRLTLSVLAKSEEGIKFFNDLQKREEDALVYIKRHFKF